MSLCDEYLQVKGSTCIIGSTHYCENSCLLFIVLFCRGLTLFCENDFVTRRTHISLVRRTHHVLLSVQLLFFQESKFTHELGLFPRC